MFAGQLTPHRACAIRCISGGVPPVLLVRQKDGPAIYLLLVSADGKPVNKQVLNLVAEPVEITGQVERQGELSILRADPATYKRFKQSRKWRSRESWQPKNLSPGRRAVYGASHFCPEATVPIVRH